MARSRWNLPGPHLHLKADVEWQTLPNNLEPVLRSVWKKDLLFTATAAKDASTMYTYKLESTSVNTDWQ